MDVSELVTDHYGSEQLGQVILRALADAGTDVDHLKAADLFPLDQLHAGGPAATSYLLERMGVGDATRLLDVGCGIGGASRMAAESGAEVTGVDLTDAFIDAATTLTARVGMGERARFLTTAAEELPFEDDSFDAAMLVHVGMNVPDKAALFAEVRRVLVPGGIFGLYEQMRVSEGALPFPLPWADDERSSFVETVGDYRQALTSAGFTVSDVEDRTAATAGPPPGGPVTNAVVLGHGFAERLHNNIAATRAGLLAAVVVLARA